MIKSNVAYVMRNGRLVPKHEAVSVPEARSDLPTPSIMPDLPGYMSVASGQWVDGRQDRREDLKRTGSRELDPSEKDWKLNERRKLGDNAYTVPVTVDN